MFNNQRVPQQWTELQRRIRRWWNIAICQFVCTQKLRHIYVHIYIYNNCTNISTYVTYIMLSIFTYTCIYIYIYIYTHIITRGECLYSVDGFGVKTEKFRTLPACWNPPALASPSATGPCRHREFFMGKPSSGSESLSDLRITSGKLTVCKLENGHLVRWFTH